MTVSVCFWCRGRGDKAKAAVNLPYPLDMAKKLFQAEAELVRILENTSPLCTCTPNLKGGDWQA